MLSSAFFHLFIIFLIMPQRNFPIFCTPEIKSLLNLWDLLLVSAISFFCLYTLRNPRRNRKSASTATEWKCNLISLQKEIEQVRNSEQTLAILRHDMRHHLNLILSMLNQNHPEKAISYIQEIGTAYDDTIVTRYCKNETLNSVISIYKTRFLERNINFLPEICVQRTRRVRTSPSVRFYQMHWKMHCMLWNIHQVKNGSPYISCKGKSFAVGNKKSY